MSPCIILQGPGEDATVNTTPFGIGQLQLQEDKMCSRNGTVAKRQPGLIPRLTPDSQLYPGILHPFTVHVSHRGHLARLKLRPLGPTAKILMHLILESS
jgi:hypothetical protein